jgi:hypothetical protein
VWIQPRHFGLIIMSSAILAAASSTGLLSWRAGRVPLSADRSGPGSGLVLSIPP